MKKDNILQKASFEIKDGVKILRMKGTPQFLFSVNLDFISLRFLSHKSGIPV